ncbi:GIY-YIG nuclease family protein [Mycobacterium arosiense]|uniref:Bacteriophage T5 Orf172 DNA-binding domain-containing protein n=1 Tax=Mycobacterium arosiense ATCC BAA-1401 = DSM 45069 TaxID=1265311 RepID=A0A1W9Z3Z4_MYCAI|nr:GIY-YIG nuclease family protein [Mycobacterium arosiense]ORA06892.1 hypothetical protein BST14_28080 [Mycobacterium arosiense ATCC BAA-1401 = DSM 45069]
MADDEPIRIANAAGGEGSYEFTDLPLTPNLFAALAQKLFAGRLLRRKEIATEVVTYHLERGGLPANGSLPSVVKKAFSTMSERGVAAPSGGYGIWRFADLRGSDDVDLADDDVLDDAVTAGAILHEYLYAYDLPAYAKLARSQGSERWPHKIGMTTVDVESRIGEQVGTALPERPRIVLTHTCSDAALLEKALHATLELRGQKVSDAPGNEWYNTNADEIRLLIDLLTNRGASS